MNQQALSTFSEYFVAEKLVAMAGAGDKEVDVFARIEQGLHVCTEELLYWHGNGDDFSREAYESIRKNASYFQIPLEYVRFLYDLADQLGQAQPDSSELPALAALKEIRGMLRRHVDDCAAIQAVSNTAIYTRVEFYSIFGDQNRDSRKARLQTFRNMLCEKQQNMMKLFEFIHSSVAHGIITDSDIFVSHVIQMAARLGCTNEEFMLLGNALRRIFFRRKTVMSHMKREPEHLFRVLTGRNPDGPVIVSRGKGGMSLDIGAITPDDYAKIAGEDPDSRLSAGVALGGSVFNAFNLTSEVISSGTSRTFTLSPAKPSLLLYCHESPGYWEVVCDPGHKGSRAHKISITYHHHGQKPVKVLSGDFKKLRVFKNHSSFVPRLTANMFNEEIIVLIGEVAVAFSSHQQSVRMCLNNESASYVTLNEPAPDRETRKHENQHNWNELFIPISHEDPRIHALQQELDASPRGKKGNNLKWIQLFRLHAREMRNDIDSRVRDEFLAYYMDGTSAEDIPSMLYTTPFYPYIQSLSEVQLEAQRLIMLERITCHKVSRHRFCDRLADAMRKEIRNIFGPGLKSDMQKWVHAIQILEKCDLERDEIIFLLYQEPVDRWWTVARRWLKFFALDATKQ